MLMSSHCHIYSVAVNLFAVRLLIKTKFVHAVCVLKAVIFYYFNVYIVAINYL